MYCEDCRRHNLAFEQGRSVWLHKGKAALPYIEEPRCMKCGKPVDETEMYCEDCRRHNLAFEQGRSVWLHKGKAAEAIYRFKFHNKRYYAELFAEEMAERCGEWIRKKQIDELIPVPLHPSKKIRDIMRNCLRKKWQNDVGNGFERNKSMN